MPNIEFNKNSSSFAIYKICLTASYKRIFGYIGIALVSYIWLTLFILGAIWIFNNLAVDLTNGYNLYGFSSLLWAKNLLLIVFVAFYVLLSLSFYAAVNSIGFLEISRQHMLNLKGGFAGFLKALKYSLGYFFKIVKFILIALSYLAIASLVSYALYLAFSSFLSSDSSFVIALLLFIVFAVIYVIYVYFLLPSLFYKDLSVKKSLFYSIKMTKGNKLYMFKNIILVNIYNILLFFIIVAIFSAIVTLFSRLEFLFLLKYLIIGDDNLLNLVNVSYGMIYFLDFSKSIINILFMAVSFNLLAYLFLSVEKERGIEYS